MLTRTITSVDVFTSEEITAEYYFNLTEAEALELELMEQLQKVGASKDPRAIVPVFKKIVHYADGVVLPSGKFTKDAAETTDFLASDAYSKLFMELIEGGEKAMSDFIDQILSFDIEDIKKRRSDAPAATRPAPQDYKPSAREIAEKRREDNEVANGEKTVVSGTPSTFTAPLSASDDEEFQAFKAFQAQNAARVAAQREAELAAQIEPAPVQVEQSTEDPQVQTKVFTDLTQVSAEVPQTRAELRREASSDQA